MKPPPINRPHPTQEPHKERWVTLLSSRSAFCRSSFRDFSDFSSFCLSIVSSAYKSKDLTRSHSGPEAEVPHRIRATGEDSEWFCQHICDDVQMLNSYRRLFTFPISKYQHPSLGAEHKSSEWVHCLTQVPEWDGGLGPSPTRDHYLANGSVLCL